jgi:1,4-dihydroxy-6-naphthoate synthase
MPRLEARTAEFGVCIHEGRFTWQQHGLGLVEDLGARWEKETSCPLPLGGIVASSRLPEETIQAVQQVIHDSLRFGLADRRAALPTMRMYAQEFDDHVLMQHVDLYVNEWTLELGVEGARALDELSVRAASIGLGTGRRLRVFS